MNEGEEGDELEGPDVHRGRTETLTLKMGRSMKMTTMKLVKSSD